MPGIVVSGCGPNDVVTTAHQFWGIIDTAGFPNFEFRELQGRLEVDGGDLKYLFADDCWFAFRGNSLIFADGFEQWRYAVRSAIRICKKAHSVVADIDVSRHGALCARESTGSAEPNTPS